MASTRAIVALARAVDFRGPELCPNFIVSSDSLEFDVKMYFALNAGLHDAAIAAWGVKRYYDYIRPISAIRYMSGLGQSSQPDSPNWSCQVPTLWESHWR